MPGEDFQSMTYVWVIEENVRGRVINLGAHYARVRYTINGIDFEVDLLNDEFLLMEDTYEAGLGCGSVGPDEEDEE